MTKLPMFLSLALVLPACGHVTEEDNDSFGGEVDGDTDGFDDDGDEGGQGGADSAGDAGADGGEDGDDRRDDGRMMASGGADDGGADDGGADDGGADDGGADDGGSDDGGSDDGGQVCEPLEVTLVAGQNHDAGWVTITATADELTIDVEAADPWVLELVHVYAGAALPPHTDGAMSPGLFPYADDLDAEGLYSLTIPMVDLGLRCGEPLNIAVHAEAHDTVACTEETAWAEGDLSFDGAWGTYLNTTLCCD